MMEEQLVVLMDPWRNKYDRLLEAHEKLQNLNQNLEEKLLKLAENNHSETQRLSYQIHELTQRLVEARLYIHQLEDENDRYRSDINVVVQLLHCKPSNFVSPKLDILPDDLQKKVASLRNGSNCKKEKKIIKVQVPTFPPTDIMYSVDKGKGKKGVEKDIVSAAIMAKILEERENERKENQKNRCKCASKIVLPLVDSETQTNPVCTISYSDFNFSDFEDDDEDDDVLDEEDDDDVIYEKKLLDLQKSPSISICSKSTSSQTPAVITVDDIMKTTQKEEELLPTPLFLWRNKESLMKHESQDSTYSTGSSNCNTTTNSSNSNISHSSRISCGGFEEDQGLSSGRSHPSPTSTPLSHSVSSASPDIQIGENQSHFFDDFDADSIILQGLNSAYHNMNAGSVRTTISQQALTSCPIITPSTITTTSLQRISGNSHSHQQTTFNVENPGRKAVPIRPQSMNMNFSRGQGSSWESHWRSTVLVHPSHSYEPLALTSTHRNTTTFSSVSDANNELLDSPLHEENPLMQTIAASGGRDRDHTHQTAQYYRERKNTEKKKTFWSRSGSTTSTETEI
ncbi:uncharacterized protein LOC110843341 [Folsomia candida]|uniref:uncharacterized protein LOC110843341 n=1 Tax=Folsomia candida TaxID=158441 RepID=UPI001604AD80|nr:uncharacterized protein LOC110843341 [Folsomia candida]